MIAIFFFGSLNLCLVSDAFIVMFVTVSTGSYSFNRLLQFQFFRCHCRNHIEQQEVLYFMISVFSHVCCSFIPRISFCFFDSYCSCRLSK